MNDSQVFKVIEETHDTWSLRFKKPEGFTYEPGQFGLFEHEIDGQLVKRSYSLSSSPTESFLQITVKRVPDGTMSTHLTHLRTKSHVRFMGPLGKFIFHDKLKDVVFIAGGSGVSPFRSMIRYMEDKKLKTNITLIYGCRGSHDIILDHELHDFNKKYKNFNLFITLDHPEEGWEKHVGYINEECIREATNNKFLDKIFYICGPPQMVNLVKKALLDMRIKDEDIKLDAWG